MLAAARRSRIVDEVHRHGAVRVSALATTFNVSTMTIRRDIDELVAQGALDKVHGGATARSAPSGDEPGFERKSRQQEAEKSSIADAALALIGPGASIGISAGTTTWALAGRLAAGRLAEVGGITVVTNSIPVADALRPTDGASDVVLTGGVRTPSDALVGPVAVASLRQLHLDVVFLGVHGMDPDAGFTTPNLLEAETDRAMVAAAQRLVILADHTKWRTVGLSTIARLDQADTLITDDALPDDARDTLREHIADVVLARRRQSPPRPLASSDHPSKGAS